MDLDLLRRLARPLTTPTGMRLLRRYQNRLLRRTIAYARINSPFYRPRFAACGLTEREVRTVEDLAQLGFFTTPADLAADPFQFLAVPKERASRITSTSGSTGEPKIAIYTREEWARMLKVVCTGTRLMGIGPADVAQVMFCAGTQAWATGSLLQEGLGQAGCFVLPTGNALAPEEQIEIMRRYGTTCLYGTPSYLQRVTVEGGRGIELSALGIRHIYMGGEPTSEEMRAALAEVWGAVVHDSYGMMEMGISIGGECAAHDGLHLSSRVVVEVIDPVTTEVLPAGQQGEFVYTTLGREATPLIRYRSGDIGYLYPYDEPCACGIVPTPRMSHVLGRSDDLTWLGTGENVSPALFDKALLRLPELGPYQVIIERDDYRDLLTFRVEVAAPDETLAERIRQTIYATVPAIAYDVFQSQTVAEPQIAFLTPGTLQAERPVKVRRIVDRRHLSG